MKISPEFVASLMHCIHNGDGDEKHSGGNHVDEVPSNIIHGDNAFRDIFSRFLRYIPCRGGFSPLLRYILQYEYEVVYFASF